MIEIGALMIADIVQCYSEFRYDNPLAVAPGMFLRRGQPKSLYRPGGSTDVLVFQRDRVLFPEDLLRNMLRNDVSSRYSLGLGRPLVETDVRVRSPIAHAVRREEGRMPA
jgi:phosphatidylserine decarboxylase